LVKGNIMAISISGNTGNAQLPPTAALNSSRSTTATAPDADLSATDKVTLGTQAADAATYVDPRKTATPAPVDLAAMLEESDRQTQAIIDLILPLVQQQGLNLAKVVSGEQQLQADPATIEKARAAIADDGEFGVTQVAERILSFAKTAIGDDPAKLATIRAAVEKGFKEATDILGGTLPDISQKTHTLIMAEFDRWIKEGIPSGDTVNLSPATDDKAAAT
jgi:hypothetical protein